MRQEFMSMKEAEKIVKKLEKEDVFIKEEAEEESDIRWELRWEV